MSKEKKEKTALFLVDCLAHMPSQPEQLQCVVDTAIAGLKRIADGQDWPEDEARATAWAAVRAANRAATWAAANRAAACAVTWAADGAADRAASRAAADWAAWTAAYTGVWAARAHPDPAKERARQAQKRKDLGL